MFIPCWEVPPAAAEGLELPLQGPDLGREGAGVSLSLPGPLQVGSGCPGAPGAAPAGPEPCRCAQVCHGCSGTCSCLTPELSPGSCPSQVSSSHPSMQVTSPGFVSQRTVPASSPGSIPWCQQSPQVCPGVQLLLFLNSQSTCNSLLSCSCSPVLPLAPGISPGIRLVRLGWIQVLQVWIPQTHLVLAALPWAGIHGTPTCAPALPGICFGVKLLISGAFSSFLPSARWDQPGEGQERGIWDVGWGCLLCWL